MNIVAQSVITATNFKIKNIEECNLCMRSCDLDEIVIK